MPGRQAGQNQPFYLSDATREDTGSGQKISLTRVSRVFLLGIKFEQELHFIQCNSKPTFFEEFHFPL